MKASSLISYSVMAALAMFTFAPSLEAQRPVPGRPVPGRPVPPPGSVRVTAASLNVRSGPSARAPKVGVVRRGQVLKVVAVSGSWLKVVSPRGFTGWVSSAYTVRVR